MLTREDKTQRIELLNAALAASDTLIIANNAGLTAAEMEILREQARQCGGKAQVVKNTLARRALADSSFQAIADDLSGPLVYGTGSDAVAVAKVFVDTAKKNPKLIIRGGVLADKAKMSLADITALASLPGRDQLLAILAGTMQAPIAKFVQTLNEIPTGVVRLLAAIRDKQ